MYPKHRRLWLLFHGVDRGAVSGPDSVLNLADSVVPHSWRLRRSGSLQGEQLLNRWTSTERLHCFVEKQKDETTTISNEYAKVSKRISDTKSVLITILLWYAWNSFDWILLKFHREFNGVQMMLFNWWKLIDSFESRKRNFHFLFNSSKFIIWVAEQCLWRHNSQG